MSRFKSIKDMSIKKKLILINLPILIIPILVFAIIIIQIYNDATVKRTEKNLQDSNIVIADRITRVLTDSENCSNYVTININRIMDTKYKEMNHLSDVTIDSLIARELNIAKIIFKEIESIVYMDSAGRFYHTDYSLLNNSSLVFESEYMEQLEESRGNSIWFNSSQRNFLVTDKEQKVLTLGKKVWKITTGDVLGYLFINIEMDEITKHLNNQLIDYYLVDDTGNVITTKQELDYGDHLDILSSMEDQTQFEVIKNKHTKYLTSKHTIQKYGWNILGITDLNLFNTEEKSFISLALTLIGSIIIISIMMSISFTNMVIAPVIKLKNGAEKIGNGNLDIKFNFKTKDEIGQLGNTFNYMSSRMKQLVEKVSLEEKKKREYELSLIQQQVKPHFLYNTLDIIVKLSEMNKHKEAQRVTKKLADYYQRSLSDSKEIITIGEEMKIVEDYLELQKIRYPDLFEYTYDVDKEIQEMPILKLTLQPLVENAIYHGLKYKDDVGTIAITGRVKDNHIEICVKDNGIGVKEEELERILALKNSPDNHFGIYSVDHRIKLFFGKEYGLEFDSQYDIGTEIKITLPRS